MDVRAWVATLFAAGLLLAGCSGSVGSDDEAASTPSVGGRGIVVIGHSGATGLNSDPGKPGGNAPENSWATGTNPAVTSVYRRLVARDPSYKPFNLAQNGADIDVMVGQARAAVDLRPKPDVVLVQGIDNDMRCDGSDPQNYAPFGATMAELLEILTRGLPDAKIYLLGLASSLQDVATLFSQAPGAAGGEGVCDFLDAAGRPRPAGIASMEAIITGYETAMATACSPHPNCRTDEGALRAMPIEAADLSDDGHPSVAGHRRQAEWVWKVFFS
jgi:hypothetical protein